MIERKLPTLKQWDEMFRVLTDELLDLERISLDPEVEPEVREAAASQMDEARITLRDMKASRGFLGFIPGGAYRL